MTDPLPTPSQLALLFDLAPAPMALFTEEGALRHANPAWIALTGRSAEALRGEGFHEAVHEADRQAFTQALAQAASGERVTAEARLVDTAGRARSLRWTMAKDTESGALCVVGYDLEGERALEREEIVRQATDAADISVWGIDPDGTIKVHLGGGVRRVGLEPGQILGQNMFQIYEGVPILALIRRALGGEVVRVEDDQVFDNHFNSVSIPVRRPDGTIVGAAGVTVTVTDLWEAQHALAEQLALVEAQQRTIEQLATPIIEVWQGVVALPLLGAFAGARATSAMEALLQTIVDKQVRFAILDMTGVESVAEATADALTRIVQAVSLLGAEALLVGLSPSVARTVVGLGLPLDRVRTLRNLEEGLRYTMARR